MVDSIVTARPDKDINKVFAATVNQRRDVMPVDNIKASAHQREPLCGEVGDRRDEIQLSVEPRLHRMLVGRLHIK